MTTVLDTNTKLENTKEEPLSSLLCRVKVSEKVLLFEKKASLGLC